MYQQRLMLVVVRFAFCEENRALTIRAFSRASISMGVASLLGAKKSDRRM
jgi:hypothetical protein